MSRAVFEKIKKLLDKNKAEYKILEHEPTPTSMDAARVREKLTGMPASECLKRGAKAMILRSGGKFYQFVLSAAKKIDMNEAKKLLSVQSLSFASPEEVEKATDCVPGSVPPFGNLFKLPVYVDKSFLENEEIDFNAGEQTLSIFMKRDDWLNAVKPIVAEFSV